MQKIRYVFILLGVLLCPMASAAVQVSIGINLPAYPAFVVVPGYPVYYAPRLQANLFFYDGMYWVYQDDNWYESTWYNGPWWLVDPEVVPLFVLRIPVRYYRLPPAYFFGWRSDAPPRWGDHWGSNWEQHRSGWDRWNRSAVPAPAPLPAYQRQYSGDRYPRQVEQQQEIQKQNYRYQPRDPVVRQQYREQAVQRAPVQQGRPQQEIQRAPAQQVRPQQEIQVAPRSQSPQRGGENVQRPIPVSPQQVRPEVQDRRQQPQPAPDQRGQQRPIPVSPQQVRPEVQDRRQPPQSAPDQREQQMPGSQGREERQQDNTRGPKQGQEQGRGRDRNE